MNSIQQAFATARDKSHGALVVYVTAGDPSLEETSAIVVTLTEAGADIVELGIPYSDPLADGPTIQAASQRALKAGCTVPGVFDCVSQIRQSTDIPLVIMTCFNPVLQYGLEAFAQEAQRVGVDGVLISDLPPSEAAEWVAVSSECGLATIFLVAPTTPAERIRQVAQRTTGFVYAISRPGVTGVRDELPPDLKESVSRIRQATDLPIAVGFGISTPSQVATVCDIADGAVVGSALVEIIAGSENTQVLHDEVAKFVSALAAAT